MSEDISRLMDDDGDDATVQRVCRGPGSEEVLATWVCYHVIGDTLRGNPHAHPELLVWFPNVLFIVIGGYLFRRLSKQ